LGEGEWHVARTAPATVVVCSLMEKEGLVVHADYWPTHRIPQTP
jgi:hypothetical protein